MSWAVQPKFISIAKMESSWRWQDYPLPWNAECEAAALVGFTFYGNSAAMQGDQALNQG
jgi:hypothetical protein